MVVLAVHAFVRTALNLRNKNERTDFIKYNDGCYGMLYVEEIRVN